MLVLGVKYCGQPAFWTGLLYDQDSLNEIYSIIKEWDSNDRDYLYKNVPKYGLNTKFKKGTILDLAKKVLKISLSGLKKRNCISSNNENDERQYLQSVEENLEKGLSPADILIDKYLNKWNKNLLPIYEENIF
mgnify:FL=1